MEMFVFAMVDGLGSLINPTISAVNPEDVKVKFKDVKGVSLCFGYNSRV